MTLQQGVAGEEYTVVAIDTDDEELNSFLFTLGCYVGEKITLVSQVSRGFVVAIRDGRYTIDANLASAIAVSD